MFVLPRPRRLLRNRQGNALIEMAITIPVLVLLCVGAADFARVLFNATTAADAAYAGSTYGALRGVNSSQFTVMEQAARQSAVDIDRAVSIPADDDSEQTVQSLTVIADRYCDCPGSPASGPTDANAVSCTTGTCSGYGAPRVYVRTRTSHRYNSAAPFPGITDNININSSSYMRVQ